MCGNTKKQNHRRVLPQAVWCSINIHVCLQTTSNNKGYFYLFSYNSGFFECQDPRVKTRNISLDEFKEQIWKDNVSE